MVHRHAIPNLKALIVANNKSKAVFSNFIKVTNPKYALDCVLCYYNHSYA